MGLELCNNSSSRGMSFDIQNYSFTKKQEDVDQKKEMTGQCWLGANLASEAELIRQKVRGCDTQSGKFVWSPYSMNIIHSIFLPFSYFFKKKVQGCDI